MSRNPSTISIDKVISADHDKVAPSSHDKQKRARGAARGADLQRDSYQRQVAELRMRGYTLQRIADTLGISMSTVSRDIAALRDRWREEAKEDFERRLVEEEEQLRHIQSCAMDDYEESRKIYTFSKAEKRMVVDESRRKPGDKEYLEMAHKCIETRLKIMGALKGVSVNVNNNGTSLWDAIASTMGIPATNSLPASFTSSQPLLDDERNELDENNEVIDVDVDSIISTEEQRAQQTIPNSSNEDNSPLPYLHDENNEEAE